MGDSVTAIDLTARRLVQAFAIVVLLAALYQLLSSVLTISMLFLFEPDFDLGRLGSALPTIEGPFAGALDWLKAHLLQVVVAYLGLVLATLLASIGLLRRKRWAQIYFIAWLLIASAAPAAWLWWGGSARFGVTPVAGGLSEQLGTALRVYSAMLYDGSAVAPTVAIMVCLLLIALLQSPAALIDEQGASSLSPFDPRRAPVTKAFVLSAIGIVVPLIGAAGLIYGFIAWIRLQNEVAAGRRTTAIFAILLGMLEIARDGYLAIALLEY